MTISQKWCALSLKRKVLHLFLLFAVFTLLAYGWRNFYVPKPSIQPGPNEGVVYGNMPSSALRVALLEKGKSEAYILDLTNRNVFEKIVPAGDYIVVYFTEKRQFAKLRTSVSGEAFQRLRLPKEPSLRFGKLQFRIVNPDGFNRQEVEATISFRNYTIEDGTLLSMVAEPGETDTALIDFVLLNWSKLTTLGTIQISVYSPPQVTNEFGDAFIEEKWVALGD